jgi:hypothetical protein
MASPGRRLSVGAWGRSPQVTTSSDPGEAAQKYKKPRLTPATPPSDPGEAAGRSGFVPPTYMTLIEQRAGAAAKVLGGWP